VCPARSEFMQLSSSSEFGHKCLPRAERRLLEEWILQLCRRMVQPRYLQTQLLGATAGDASCLPQQVLLRYFRHHSPQGGAPFSARHRLGPTTSPTKAIGRLSTTLAPKIVVVPSLSARLSMNQTVATYGSMVRMLCSRKCASSRQLTLSALF
jgi:hypothetical protein